MRRWALWIITAIILLLLVACGADQDETPDDVHEEDLTEIEEYYEEQEEPRAELITLDWGYALDLATQRRAGIVKPEPGELEAMTEGRTPLARFPQRFRNDWSEQEDAPPDFFTIEDAVADAWVLFNTLRYVYGGYVYFGGDDVFSAMLGDVTTEFFLLGEEMIRAADFARILHRHINQIVVDNHFWIGDERMGSNFGYFHRHGVYYDKTENGFRNRDTDLYLTEIEGYSIQEAMRLHTNADGALFYRPVMLLESAAAVHQADFVYEDGSVQRRALIREAVPQRQMQLPTLEYIDFIPVLTVMAMGFDGHEAAWGIDHATAFMSYAQNLRQERVVIVDIRGNIGGNGLLPVRWLNLLTHQVAPSNYVWLSARPYRSGDFDFDPDNIHQNPPNSWRTYANVAAFGDYHTIFNTEPRRIIPREQMLILLTDRATSSAAEDFVDRIFNIQNTLVIGTATAGALAFDATYSPINLPNTGIPFGLGRAMMLWPDGHFAEGAGIVPDIWVSGDALAAALALVVDE